MERTRLMFRFKGCSNLTWRSSPPSSLGTDGKTLNEARCEVRRGIEVVDFACAALTLLQGRILRLVGETVDQD